MPIKIYGFSALSVLFSLLLMLLINPWSPMSQSPFLFFFGAVIVSAWYGGREGGIFATFICAFLANFFFIAPHHQLALDSSSILRTFLFFTEGIFIAVLCGSLRKAERLAKTNLLRAKANEAKYRRLMESNVIGIVFGDIKGAIAEANDEFLRTSGLTRHDIQAGRVRWDEVMLNEANALEELLEKGTNGPYEKVLLAKDGYQIPVVVGGVLLENGSDEAIGIVVDLTQLKKTEQRLALQYSVTRTLAEARNIDEAVPSILQSLCQDLGWQLGIIWQLDRQSNLLHYSASSHLSAINVEELLAFKRPATFKRGEGLLGRIWASGKPIWIANLAEEKNFLRAESALAQGLRSAVGFPILLDKEVLGVIECFSDKIQEPNEELLQMMAAIGTQIGQFMERKRTEVALQESQALFSSFMNNSPAAAYIKDEAGRYLYVNLLVERKFNRQLIDWLGKTDFELFSPEIAQQWRENDLKVLSTNQPLEVLEQAIDNDGKQEYVMSFKFPLRDASGGKLVAGMSVDITEQMKIQQALQENTTRLSLALKAARMGDWSWSASTDMITFSERAAEIFGIPSGPYMTWTQMQKLLHEEDRERARLAVEAAIAQNEFYDIEYRVNQPNGGQKWVAAIETVALAAEAKGIKIQTQFPKQNEFIAGDRTRLQQIVWNLLSNSIKFTPTGGRVEVLLQWFDSYAQIQIIDNGQGIHSDFLPYVFESFRQSDSTITRKFGGLGLGLTIVRHLVELHGGTVQAESFGEGKGATFSVRLPRMAANPQISPEIEPFASNFDLKGLEVLVVDDEADMRDLIAVILEQYGVEVRVAASAQEAISILDEFQPDILIGDIGMPEMDGYTLLRQIRSRSPQQGGQIPAIALSAYAGEYNRKQALAAGFQMHLGKPIEPAQLVAAISRLVKLNQESR